MNYKLIVFCTATLLVIACNNDNEPDTNDGNKPLESIVVTPASAVVTVDKTIPLSAAPAPADANPEEKPFVWTSGDAGIATVSSSGLVKGISPGATEITVSGRLNSNIRTTVPVTVTTTTYQNPVIGQSLPDPTVIKASNGWFYLYATEDTPNVPIWRSQNLVDWLFVGTCFTSATRPPWPDDPDAGIWAPDINYINGKYVLYFSRSTWGGVSKCGIGAATANDPGGPFTNHGKLFNSAEIGVQNSIDPFYMEDEGKKYLVWGSYGTNAGIHITELSDDGLSVKDMGNVTKIAGTHFEGTYIHKRGTYYYLFASTGSCCSGANSTYALVVGRAENLSGPYIDKDSDPLLSTAYNWAWVIQKNDHFVGPGHCSEIVTDDAGNDWILYHGYVKGKEDAGRQLLMSQIIWENDWPSVAGGSPAVKADAPYFR
jgi:arabinan endo-1,5-alpha-L-arabinosidase